MDGSWTCSLCHERSALSFCLCAASETLLCSECIGTHHTKNPGSIHQTIPIAGYKHRRSPGFLDRLKARNEAVRRANELSRDTKKTVDKCERKLRRKVEIVITMLYDYIERKCQELQEARLTLDAHIAEALLELESRLYDDNPVFNSPISQQLLSKPTETISLFEYSLDSKLYPACLDDFLKFSITLPQPEDVSDPLSIEILPSISKNTLCLYNSQGLVSQQAKLKTSFTEGARFILIESSIVLGVGGLPASASTVTINLDTFVVNAEKPMKMLRDGPGLAKYQNSIYVFGGYASGAMKECEKITLQDREWQILPDMMYPRGAFCPCVEENRIYLPDVRQSHGVLEVFLPASESFETLSVQLPQSQTNSIAFILNDCLTIVTSNEQLIRWTVNSEEEKCTVGQVFMEKRNCCTANCGPIQIGRNVYWVVANTGELAVLDVDGGILMVMEKTLT